MTRNEINKIIKDAEIFFSESKFMLPPWGYWGLNDWQENDMSESDIFSHQLGWDITDFGSGDFNSEGLVLFTIRNGALDHKDKPYAEKIMIVCENQITPFHFHWKKTEDIINRGGGNLIIRLYGSTNNGKFSDESIVVMTDGVKRTVSPGGDVVLTPGESICLETGMYHSFWAEEGKGRVLVGEVSVVSDDERDNRFYKELLRFPDIIEDVEPYRLLTSDYKQILAKS